MTSTSTSDHTTHHTSRDGSCGSTHSCGSSHSSGHHDDTGASRRPTLDSQRSAPLRRATPLLGELDREWDRLRRRPQALRRARAWHHDQVLAPHLVNLRNLDELVAATQPEAAGLTGSDAVLASLTALAAHDDLAGRIVLQRLLPGLISRSRRWEGPTHQSEACDIAIGAAWLAIRDYDVTTRSRNIAPALIADAMWIGFRRCSRRKAEQEIPIAGDLLGAQAAPGREVEPITALAGVLRAAQRAGVPAADLDLVRHLMMAGSPSQAARNCNVTVRTIRNRRDSAAFKIRQALGPEWSDWSDPVCAA